MNSENDYLFDETSNANISVYPNDYMLDAAAELEAEDASSETRTADLSSSIVNEREFTEPDHTRGSPQPVPNSGPSTSKAKAKPKKAAPSKAKAKPKPKPSAATKPSAKSAPKARVAQLKAGAGTSASSRGRSISETPAGSDHGSPAPVDFSVPEDEPEEVEDDTKLYCVCQTLYNDDEIMIACDKCDEWYHPPCVNLPKDKVELVDTFFCPLCVKLDPTLVTSYKPACARLTCKHAARPPLSKYCSEDCGILAVLARVDAVKGIDIDLLLSHPAVANAKPIEGILVKSSNSVLDPPASAAFPLPSPGTSTQPISGSRRHRSEQLRDNEEIYRQLSKMNEEIQRLSSEREQRQNLRQAVEARLQLLGRASDRRRASTSSTSSSEGPLCFFDSRLILDDNAWEDWLNDGGWVGMQQEDAEEEDGPWLCKNKKKCELHYGWEELKAADFELEYKILGLRLSEMSTREREVRLRSEDLESLLHARQTTAALRAQAMSGPPQTSGGKEELNMTS